VFFSVHLRSRRLILMLLVMERGAAGLICIPVLFVSMSGFIAGVLLVRVARRVKGYDHVVASSLWAHRRRDRGVALEPEKRSITRWARRLR
jgi:hypothetical protein